MAIIQLGSYQWGLDSLPGPFLPIAAQSSTPSHSVDLLLAGPYKDCYPSHFLSARNGFFIWPVLSLMAHTRSPSHPLPPYWPTWFLSPFIFPANINVHFLAPFFLFRVLRPCWEFWSVKSESCLVQLRQETSIQFPDMIKENITIVEHKWDLVLKTLDKKYEAFIANSLEAKPMIKMVCTTLVNILKLCYASS